MIDQYEHWSYILDVFVPPIVVNYIYMKVSADNNGVLTNNYSLCLL